MIQVLKTVDLSVDDDVVLYHADNLQQMQQEMQAVLVGVLAPQSRLLCGRSAFTDTFPA